ncbi:thioredoxin domain-containing protein [Pseudomonas guariconensis]|uniref:hypothetical protein n=1 Tax=Pseudomonas guariconensis TaxID=1288410 RepID=UPI003905D22F
MRKILLVPLMALALIGCGESSDPTSTAWIHGEVPGNPDFRMPGSVFALKSAVDTRAQSGRAWWIEKSSWKPQRWSLWIASNVYSDYVAPKNDQSYLRNGFGRALPAVERSAQEARFIASVHQWLVENNIDVEVNYLGYDYVPASLGRTDDVDKGYWLTHSFDPCEKAFRLCIDNYYISPVDRYSGGGRMSFKEWISPYLTFQDGERGDGQKYVIDQMGGLASEKSPFYDYWPTMVFLVNPDGEVVRAWLPQKNESATLRLVQGAIVTDIGGDYKDLAISDKTVTPGTPRDAYYGEYFIESNVGKVLEVFQEIMGGK